MTKRNKRNNALAYAVLTPFIIYYIIFSILPIVMVFFISFTKWTGVNYNFGALSFNNYIEIFNNPEYFRTLVNTLIMGVTVLVLNFVFGFVFGYLMSLKLRGMGLFRAVWYFPVVISMAVISLILNTVISPVGGALNTFLEQIGLEPVMWQESVFWMFFWIILLVFWKGIGGTIIFFVAGFSSISPAVLEAAQIDGAYGMKKMIYVIIPMMKNMLVYILITSLMGVFGIFEPVLLVSNGAPDGKTNVIMFQIYNEAFMNFNMGMSCALSVVVLFLTMGLSVANMRLLRVKS